MEPITSNYVGAFLIGVASAYPSIMPTAVSLVNKPECELYEEAGLEKMFIWLPPLYGLLHIILFIIIHMYVPSVFQSYWLVGLIIGLIYPTLGTITGHAKRIYGIKSTFKLFLGAQIMYLLFYGVGVNYVSKMLRR
jgi:hypothetical protein